jgi:hypothetical protein
LPQDLKLVDEVAADSRIVALAHLLDGTYLSVGLGAGTVDLGVAALAEEV